MHGVRDVQGKYRGRIFFDIAGQQKSPSSEGRASISKHSECGVQRVVNRLCAQMLKAGFEEVSRLNNSSPIGTL